MARMTGGEALVKQLYREGVRVVFGLPGVQLYGVVAALRDEPGAAHEAVEQLRTGRPRPVHLELPPDTMESEGEVELVEPSRAERPAASRSDIDRAAGMLLAAERPVIYAGGGVHLSGCHDVLAAVAEYLQAGVVQSAEGKGALGDASDLSLGAALWPQNALRDRKSVV